jgi:hypothetical protein
LSEYSSGIFLINGLPDNLAIYPTNRIRCQYQAFFNLGCNCPSFFPGQLLNESSWILATFAVGLFYMGGLNVKGVPGSGQKIAAGR